MLSYSIVKALHIIFVVSYFAGIFYIVRLFIYHTEALQESEPKRSILHQQFSYMEERLWNIITVPAFIIMTISGILMIYMGDWALLEIGWFHIKLFFILVLFYYHFWCWKMISNLKKSIRHLLFHQATNDERNSYHHFIRCCFCSYLKASLYKTLVLVFNIFYPNGNFDYAYC